MEGGFSAVRPVGAEDNPMGSLSIWHWIIVIGVVLLLFGRGKISELMGDVAQGIKAFKKGMQDDETAKSEPAKSEPAKTIDHQPGDPVKTRSETTV
jgi:sec-independent protein translocase protein TatA